jgi:hypothetical protein
VLVVVLVRGDVSEVAGVLARGDASDALVALVRGDAVVRGEATVVATDVADVRDAVVVVGLALVSALRSLCDCASALCLLSACG